MASHLCGSCNPTSSVLVMPFGVGTGMFGLSSEYNRASAINRDVSFQVTCRLWREAESAAGVAAFGHLLADQAAMAVPAPGGEQGPSDEFCGH